jgi:hypothetical protein
MTINKFQNIINFSSIFSFFILKNCFKEIKQFYSKLWIMNALFYGLFLGHAKKYNQASEQIKKSCLSTE